MSILKTPISGILSTTKTYLSLLEKMGITTLEDFMLYYPRTHEDQSQLKTIAEVIVGEVSTLKGVLTDVENQKTKFGKILTKAVFTDSDGNIAETVWFNQKYLRNSLPKNIPVLVTGKVKYDYGRFSISSPVVEVVKEDQLHTGRIIPIYREHDKISSRWIREKMGKITQYFNLMSENLPLALIKDENLISREKAIFNIHFPESEELLQKSKERLAFEELFFIQKSALKRKQEWQDINPDDQKSIPMDIEFIKTFFEILPFKLTQAQKVVLYEVLRDMEKKYPMSRLLEGDVGSGKTVVVVAAMLNVFKAGYQSVIMAPTEVLANQHFSTITKLVKEFTDHPKYAHLLGQDKKNNTSDSLDLFSSFLHTKIPKVVLLTGNVTGKQRKIVLSEMKSGEASIIIGTHALIQQGVEFCNLGLVTVDEQHRFGVDQRENLKTHGTPHFLNMTATPIPRSLALTAYGDHDLSVIDELPKGRKTIITKVAPEKERAKIYEFLKDQIEKGRQVYVICPLIDDSDVLEVKSVTKEYKFLKTDIFPEYKVGLMHGKLTSGEKAYVMQEFKEGKIKILVSTSVIEVGIDVPNATMMLIEGAERFGLAQLHQFRGRVGRGEHQSYCLLFSDSENVKSLQRLQSMEKFSDGFKLAEIDLRLRGPGEVYGIRQSGVPDLKMASLSDTKMVVRVKKATEKVLNFNKK